MTSERQLQDIEILEDRSEALGPKDGFLRLTRLVIRNRYRDGTSSKAYPCDIVSRPCVDAVTVVLYQRDGEGVRVGLRECLRAPVWMRRTNPDVPFPDDPPIDTLLETVAGVLEPSDNELPLPEALARRAQAESLEEVGLTVALGDLHPLGGAGFPTPGVADEKVYFMRAEVDFATARRPEGDGSAMEEVGGLVILPLDEALERCDTGEIADMKTEIALRRLARALDP